MRPLSRRELLGVAASATGGSVFTRLGGDKDSGACEADSDLSAEQATAKAERLAAVLHEHCGAIEELEVSPVAMANDFIVWVEYSTEPLDPSEAIGVFKTTVKVFKWFAEDHDAFAEAYFSHDMEATLYANYTVKREWTPLPSRLLIRKARTTYERAE